MKPFYIFFSLCFTVLSYAQTKIDSLHYTIKSSAPDSLKIESYLKLIDIYKRVNLDSALIYTNHAINLAKTSENKKQLARSKHAGGIVYSYKNNYLEAERLYNEALEVFSNLNSKENILRLKIDKASLYNTQFKTETAIEMYLDALKFAIDLGDKNSEARIYSNLGILYKKQKQPDIAIEYLEKALILVRELKFNPGISACLINLATVYYDLKNYDKAIVYLDEAIPIKEQMNDKLGLCRALSNLATNYIDKQENNLAKDYYLKALNLANEINNPEQHLIINFGLARIYFKEENYEECIKISKELIKFGDSIEQLEALAETYKLMSKAYAKLGRYENAHANSILYKRITDSIYNNTIVEVTNNLNAKYKSEEKEKEIAQLTAKNNEIILQKKNQRTLLLGGLLIVSMLGLLFFFLYKNKQKLHKKLVELDDAKYNFFTNISHEFRTPLSLIQGPIQEQLNSKNISSEQRSSLKMMQRNTNRLLKLVNQLLDISKIELGSFQLNLAKTRIISLIASLVESFEFAAKQKMIILNSDLDDVNTEVYIDQEVIEKIAINILSNAVKYTPNNGQIVCRAYVNETHFSLEIKNTGEKLSPHDIKHLFEPFYRVSNEGYGNGIGLALVKELVDKHNGKIALNSTDKWTVFKVDIPVKKINSDRDYTIKPSIGTVINQTKNNNADNQHDDNLENVKSMPLILVVDDNSDVRLYLAQIFKAQYKLIYGSDGQEGINQAINHIPDFIISDVMMPIKNGFVLSSTLKNDARTSHIPIILLTAKVGDKNTIEGIEAGADDYITKPFNSALLKSKVKSILQTRKKLQKRYAKELILKPNGTVFNSVEEEFLKRVQNILDNNLVESSFSHEDFCVAVGMSRMQLHRKLKAITGYTTSEFIRTQRLKLAANLLKTSKTKISQVGYSVGFDNHAYFSKCFKDQFGITPSQYSKQYK